MTNLLVCLGNPEDCRYGDVAVNEMRERQSWREWALIGLLTLIMLIKGVLWSLAFPLWQGPDEEDHYGVIQFVGEFGRLPDEGEEFLPDDVALSRVLADVGRLPYNPEQRQAFSATAVGPGEPEFAALPASTRTSFELQAVGKLNHATPVYYLLSVPIYRLFRDGDLLHRAQVQRLWAVVLSSPIVVVAYLIARLLFPQDGATSSGGMMRLTIPALVAFHPMITEISAVVSVDGFYFVCYSSLIYLSLRVFRDGFDWRYGLAMGLIFAVGMLTKPTLNGYAPLIALLIVYDWWRGGASGQGSGGAEGRRRWLISGRRRSVILGTGVMAVAILLPVGWWMARSWRLNQDLFYFNPVLKGHRIIQEPFYDYAFWPHLLDYYRSVMEGMFVTWWAHFGWIDTPLPPWVYRLLQGLTLLAIVGLLIGLLRVWRRRPNWQGWRIGRTAAPLVVWLFLALSIVIPILLIQVYDLTFWWEYGNGRGLQGRYWLGTVVPMLTFLVLGLAMWLPRRWQGGLHMALRVGMVLLNMVSLLWYILPRYYL